MADVWTQGTDGTWTLDAPGGDRTVLVTDEPLPSLSSIRARFADADHEVAVCLLMSPDGKSCYEVHVTTGTGGDIEIRRVWQGVAAVAVDTAAHGLSDAVPYTLEVRFVGGKIQAFLDGATTAAVEYTVPSTDLFLQYDGFGFASDVDGAKVLGLEICTLVAELTERTEVLVAVAGGEVWASTDGESVFRVDARAMNPSGPVSMAEFEQKMYMVDGTNARIFDPSTLTVSAWVPTGGALPGAESGVSGSTSATLIENHIGRLWLAGMRADPQNIVTTAINDPLDLDTGSDLPGAAFALSVSDTAKIGQPVVAMLSTSSSRILIGCTGSIWEIRGDPTLEGAVDVNAISRDFGVSGKDAWTLAGEGLVVGHARQGVTAIPEGGSPQIISRGTLTIDPLTNRDWLNEGYTQIIRDVGRHGTHVFLTLISGTSTHLWLDERINGLSSAVGGYFPERYPSTAGPTASCIYRGEVLLGGTDGYIRVFDDDRMDDDFSTIASNAPLGLVVEPDIQHDTLLEGGELILSSDSDPVTITVYEAATPEEAYGVRGDRLARYSKTTGDRYIVPLTRRCRAGAIVLDIANVNLNGSWKFNACQITTTPLQRLHKRYTETTTAPYPDASNTTTTTTSSSSTFETGPDTTTTTSSTTTTTTTTSSNSTTVEDTTASPTIPPFTDFETNTTTTTAATTTADTCVLCNLWMGLNYGGLIVDDKRAYLLGTGGLSACQNQLLTTIEAILESDICNLPSRDNIIVRWLNQAIAGTGTMTYAAFMALNAPPGGAAIFNGWVVFTCEDNGLPGGSGIMGA
jgi:hypothetical protein